MEEFVGGLWDRIAKRAARRDHPEAAVHLADAEKFLGVVFRALGGDPGLRVATAADSRHGARRRFVEWLAATGEKSAQASLDMETLRLPPSIAIFPDKSLNRDLYIWLTAAAAHEQPPNGEEWIVRNQQATLAALRRYPGLRPRYERLVAAANADRPSPELLPADEAEQETAVRQALTAPGSVASLPPLRLRKARPLQPVPLWLYPAPPAAAPGGQRQHQDRQDDEEGKQSAEAANKRYEAKRVDTPEDDAPVIFAFWAENLLSWGEYIRINRPVDEDENHDAARAAEDLDKLAVAEDDGKRVASTVRFDLDLPAAAEDDLPLGPGILLPEWDYRSRQLKPDYCRLQPMLARNAEPVALPEHLRRPARKLKSQFAALAPARRWLKAQPEGSELDVDACVRVHADRLAGWHFSGAGTYLAQKNQERDLSCLVLADLSLSTDSWVSDEHRVIDVIRDSLLLFSEALSATGDRFAFYGFSSLKRDHVRLHEIKTFDAPLDAAARGRIAAIRPGYYTRMGTAIRHATSILEKEPTAMRLLLVLTDGKPHDIDHYEGRYGIEDTRMALIESRQAGLRPFCVTIDREGPAYLPHLFGPGGFTILRKPEHLPAQLPLLYAQLTAN